MIQGIPTTYNGVKMRSRLEADVALLLDRMGCDWEHEPESFLLPDGVHYWPDFRVNGLWLWVEARGYVSEDGEQKLRSFRKNLPERDSFAVIHSEGATLTEPAITPTGMDHETHGAVGVGECMGCGRGFFYPEPEGWACRWCDSDMVDHRGRVEIIAGKLHIGGVPVADFHLGGIEQRHHPMEGAA